MGSVIFNNDLTVNGVCGSPSCLGNSGVKQLTGNDIPLDLLLAHRAINIFDSIPDGVVDGINNSDTINVISALFGSKSSCIEYEWIPTDLIINGHRAWCYHKRFTEGGGEGYFGSPTNHDWIIAGAWIDDKKLSLWADRLISSSKLARLIADNWDNLSYSIACDDETITEGCTVDKSWCVLDGGVKLIQTGRFHKVNFWIETPKPDIWQISLDHDVINGIYYPFLLANNGNEQRKLTYTDVVRDAYNHLYTNDLSGFLEHIPPKDVTGKYTIYFPDADGLRKFFVSNNITAKLLDTPYYDIATVDLAWRDKAFLAGAKKHPEYQIISPNIKHGDMLDGHNISIYGNNLHIDEIRPNKYFNGFVLMPAGIQLPLGHSIREVDDNTLGRDEIRIFMDGTV